MEPISTNWFVRNLGQIGTWLANRKVKAAVDEEVSAASKYFKAKGCDISIYRNLTWSKFFKMAPNFQALFFIGNSSNTYPVLFNNDGVPVYARPEDITKHLGGHTFDSVTLHSCFSDRRDLEGALLSPGGSWWGSRGTYNPLTHQDNSPKRTIGKGRWRNFAP